MHIYKIVVVLHITNNENKTTMTNLVGKAVTIIWKENGEVAEEFSKVQDTMKVGNLTVIEGLLSEGGRSKFVFNSFFHQIVK